MAERKYLSNEQAKTASAEQLWLTYFNQYLFENKIITESRRNRMIAKIESRKGSTSVKKQNEKKQEEA